MLEKALAEFLSNAESLIKGAAVSDDFVKIKTEFGNAVLISEAEWNILREALAVALHSK